MVLACLFARAEVVVFGESSVICSLLDGGTIIEAAPVGRLALKHELRPAFPFTAFKLQVEPLR
jgi:hypothetical protein